MLGLIALALTIYGLLFLEIRKWRREVEIEESWDREITQIINRAELIRAVRSDIARDSESDREWEGTAFALDEPTPPKAA